MIDFCRHTSAWHKEMKTCSVCGYDSQENNNQFTNELGQPRTDEFTCAHCSRDMRTFDNICSNGSYCISVSEHPTHLN